MLLRDDINAIARRGRQDPVWWVRNVLGSDPMAYQRAILRAIAAYRLVTVRSCHGIGKSFTAGGLATPWFLLNHPFSEVVTTAPSQRQVQGIIWKEINRAVMRSKRPLGGECKLTRWDIKPGWFATGYTSPANAPDKFQGFHPASGYGLVIVDEAAGIDQRIYDEGISSIISSADSKLLLIGNPTNPVGEFRDSHKPPRAGEEGSRRAHYCRIKVDAFMTPNFLAFGITQTDIESGAWEEKIGLSSIPFPFLVTPDWVADRYRKWGRDSALYRSRVLAEFPMEGADNLIPIYQLDNAKDRVLPEEGLTRWGFDVAMQGDDFSVIGKRWASGRYREHASWAKGETVEQVNRIEYMVREEASPPFEISVDSIGVGKGVYDLLRSVHLWNAEISKAVRVGEFNGSHAASDPARFMNARAEGYWKLRAAFEEGEVDIDPEDEDLFYELSELRWKTTAGGKIRIESKNEFKERTGRSPDRADAMMYAFAGFSKKRVTVS